ncbi:MAG: PDZ domain-containing protein [Saprospiraceae bacterium]|nr:PDZ domain-containing protein [Saprospiraceae bacterium]
MHRHYIIIAFCFLWMLQPTCPAQGQTIFGYRTNDNAFLGVTADQISKRKVQLLGLENRYGEYITSIVEGSAAEKAGLLPLDFLTGINDEELDWSTDLSDLLGQYQAGDEVNIHFVRKGKTMTKLVTLGKRRSTNWNMSSFSFPQNNNEPFLGISKHDAHSDYELGVRVNIIDMSTADDLGMKDGDVILKINDYPMVDWEDISGAIDMLQVGDNINLEWERVGKSYKQSGTIKSKADRNSSRYSFSASGYNNTSDYAFLRRHLNVRIVFEVKNISEFKQNISRTPENTERPTNRQSVILPLTVVKLVEGERTLLWERCLQRLLNSTQ